MATDLLEMIDVLQSKGMHARRYLVRLCCCAQQLHLLLFSGTLLLEALRCPPPNGIALIRRFDNLFLHECQIVRRHVVYSRSCDFFSVYLTAEYVFGTDTRF